jgi:hypothetical protein
MRAKLDGVAEPFRLGNDLILQVRFLVGNAEILPGGDREQEDEPGAQDELGNQAAADLLNEWNHGRTPVRRRAVRSASRMNRSQ